VPADWTSTITIAFGPVTAARSNYSSFTVTTTGGTFAAPVNGTSVTVACAGFGAVGGTALKL